MDNDISHFLSTMIDLHGRSWVLSSPDDVSDDGCESKTLHRENENLVTLRDRDLREV